MKASEFDKKFDDGENILLRIGCQSITPSGRRNQAHQCGFPSLDGGIYGSRSATPGGNPPIDYQNVVGRTIKQVE